MKKYISILLAITLVAACTEDYVVTDTEPIVFRASIEEDSETRTHLNESLQNRWDADDRVSIFSGNVYNQQYRFDGNTGDNDGTFSAVGSPGYGSYASLSANYAVYPYSSATSIAKDGTVSYAFPDTQEYVDNSFGRGANTMIAVTGSTSDGFLYFKNVCGFLKVSLYGDATIKSITLKGNNGEKTAGNGTISAVYNGVPSVAMSSDATESITLNCGDGVALGASSDSATDFYFVIPPVEFTSGFTLTAMSTDGKVFEKCTSKSISIIRNKIQKMAALEFECKNMADVPHGELSFYAEEASTIALSVHTAQHHIALEYLMKDSQWEPYTIGRTLTLAAGDSVCFRAGKDGNTTMGTSNGFYRFSMSGSIRANGNIMSLLDQSMKKTSVPEWAFRGLFFGCTSLTTAPRLPAKSLATYCYFSMFNGCSCISSAPELPATTLAPYCYTGMFANCTSLITAPRLPAEALEVYCYFSMFNGCSSLINAPEMSATDLADFCCLSMFTNCTSLTTAPKLPATTLANYCYYDMFQGCINLTTAPALPVETLAQGCYERMFSGCTSLTTAPELPAETLADWCYSGMFDGCTSLINAPEMLANNLAERCCWGMFSGCTSLTTAPKLRAETLANNCYENMFSGCTSLINAPEILANNLAEWSCCNMFDGCTSLINAPEMLVNNLAEYCCQGMFRGCTSLTTAPKLRAETLAKSCYQSMFSGCTSLISAPELPAKALAESCYAKMFYGCSKLNYIKMLATDISATACLSLWLSGVSSKGTFVKNSAATWDIREASIPTGWTVDSQ